VGVWRHVTEDGEYLIIQVWLGTEPKNRVFYKKIASVMDRWWSCCNDYDARYEFIDNDGPVFYLRTDLNASCFQVIAIDTRKPQRGNWRIVVPEVPKVLLEDVSTVGGQMFCQYLRDAKTEVKCFDYAGKLIRDVKLPGIGSAGGFWGHRKDTETFFTFMGFTEPGAIYRMDFENRREQAVAEARGEIRWLGL
jgi:prolyl oligopeptidase